MSDLLTTAQAADVAGITPAAFRKAASTDPTLREAKTMIDARTPAYPRTAVEAWRAAHPRRIVRGAALMVLAVLALTACGAQDGATLPVAARPDVAASHAPAVIAAPVAGDSATHHELRVTPLDVKALACDAITFSGNLVGPVCAQIMVADAAQDMADAAFAPWVGL